MHDDTRLTAAVLRFRIASEPAAQPSGGAPVSAELGSRARLVCGPQRYPSQQPPRQDSPAQETPQDYQHARANQDGVVTTSLLDRRGRQEWRVSAATA